jgi:hypothetical protein
VAYNTDHRQQLAVASGLGIFICGNKKINGKIKLAPGVVEEFALLVKLERVPIPIGASGSAAQALWNQVRGDMTRYYGRADVAQELDTLNDPTKTDEAFMDAIFGIIDKVYG